MCSSREELIPGRLHCFAGVGFGEGVRERLRLRRGLRLGLGVRKGIRVRFDVRSCPFEMN